MNVVIGAASSECSSGCESGWTLYLQHSTSNKGGGFYEQQGKKISGLYNNNNNNVVEEDEEEDLSMVSDASSGPPHFDHDIDYDDDDDDEEEVEVEVEEVLCYGVRKKRSIHLSTNHHHHHHQCCKAQDFNALDDTASSPIFTSKKSGDNCKGSLLKRIIVDYSSQGFSTNHFHQERSNNSEEHYAFIQSPLSTQQFTENQWS